VLLKDTPTVAVAVAVVPVSVAVQTPLPVIAPPLKSDAEKVVEADVGDVAVKVPPDRPETVQA
jgi:hypothetical protein